MLERVKDNWDCWAGLVGCLAALLCQKGYDVTLFEYRPDPRTVDSSKRNLRSINLAVSSRGLELYSMLIQPWQIEF